MQVSSSPELVCQHSQDQGSYGIGCYSQEVPGHVVHGAGIVGSYVHVSSLHAR